MSGKTFWTYRFTGNGKGPEELLKGRIQEAVTDFYQKRQALPAGIAVNPKLRKQAVADAKALELKASVEMIGGVLLNEVWLEIGEG